MGDRQEAKNPGLVPDLRVENISEKESVINKPLTMPWPS